jgi:hypothetical protein
VDKDPGQEHINKIVGEWQYLGHDMIDKAAEMAKRDKQYFTGSAINRDGREAWLDEFASGKGKICP